MTEATCQKTASPRIARIVERLRKKQQAAKKLDLAIEELRASVIEFLGEPAELVYQERLIAALIETSSRRIDTGRLKIERPDLYEEFSTELTSRRLVLK